MIKARRYGGGQISILLERLPGPELPYLQHRSLAFDLSPSTSIDEAMELAATLNRCVTYTAYASTGDA
jgi:hypothetical protein